MAKYSSGLEDNLDLPRSSRVVLEGRYLTKDSSGNVIETAEEMYGRAAKDVAAGDAFYLDGLKEKTKRGMPTKKLYKIIEGDKRIKQREEEFSEMMRYGYFLPNSPTLMNAGRKLGQLAACFALPIEDSMEKIFDAKKNMAIVHKSGGGTGFSFSRLRPNGAMIYSTQGYSPGPISFAFTFNEDAGQITQGGKRRGANMGILRADHPDALCWSKVKRKEGVLKNFNLSIAFTDENMKAVKNDEYIMMDDPREGVNYTVENARNRVEHIFFGKNDKFETSWKFSEDEKKIMDKYSGKEIGKVEDGKLYLKAKDFFETIAEEAWRGGDPGVIFLDTMNKDNPTPLIGEIESTNPCGEQPLLPNESCNLGSIHLGKMVSYEKEALFGKLDESLLEKTIRSSVRFLDNVIDRNKYPLKEIEKITLANRKIGLGIMGWADYLAGRGIGYESDEALEEAEKVMKFIQETSVDESRKLAKERGAFPNFEKSVYFEKSEPPIRNATTTTIAPTGTISIINFNASQGIEPLFSPVQVREVKETIGENLIEINPQFERYLKKNGMYDEEIINKIAEEGTFDNIYMPQKIKEDIKKLFPSAHDVSPEWHVKMQAAFQKHIHNAVSKTVNLKHDAPPEDVIKVYNLAYESGCKGVTIYRDESKEVQILIKGKGKKGLEAKVPDGFRLIPIRGRDVKKIGGLPGVTYDIETGCGPLFVTLNYDEKGVIETFLNMNPPGGCSSAQTSSQGILSSLLLHRDENPERIAKHLRAIVCPKENELFGKLSCPEAEAKAIDLFNKRDFPRIKKGYYGVFFKEEKNKGKEANIDNPIKKENQLDNGNNLINPDKIFCPECKTRLDFGEGCKSGLCRNCGYTKC